MENAGTKPNRPEPLTIDQELTAVAEAVAGFPDEFGLRGYPGKIFRASKVASYYSPGWNHGNWNQAPAAVQIQTQTKNEAGEWIDFAKGTEGELRREVVAL